MGDYSFKYCVLCSGHIHMNADICPKCGGSQSESPTGQPIWVMAGLITVCFLSVILLGIISAKAIPRFSGYMMKKANQAAVRDIVSAKNAVRSYHRLKGTYPRSLGEVSFKAGSGVTVELRRKGEKRYALVAVHAYGDREFETTLDQSAIYSRERGSRTAEPLPEN